MSVRGGTEEIDRYIAELQKFGGRKRVVVEGLSAEDEAKAKNLARHGRNFFASTPQLEAAIDACIDRAVNSGTFDADALDREIAATARAHVLARFATQGGDVTLAPVKPATRAADAARGLDPRVGVATGRLLAALSRAPWIVRR